MLFVRNLQVNLHKKGHIWTKLHFGVVIISNNAPKFTYCSQKSVKKKCSLFRTWCRRCSVWGLPSTAWQRRGQRGWSTSARSPWTVGWPGECSGEISELFIVNFGNTSHTTQTPHTFIICNWLSGARDKWEKLSEGHTEILEISDNNQLRLGGTIRIHQVRQ